MDGDKKHPQEEKIEKGLGRITHPDKPPKPDPPKPDNSEGQTNMPEEKK